MPAEQVLCPHCISVLNNELSGCVLYSGRSMLIVREEDDEERNTQMSVKESELFFVAREGGVYCSCIYLTLSTPVVVLCCPSFFPDNKIVLRVCCIQTGIFLRMLMCMRACLCSCVCVRASNDLVKFP